MSKAQLSEIEDCFDRRYLSVKQLSLQHETYTKLIGFTSGLIIAANEFLNLNVQMTEQQIALTAELIAMEFTEFNLADLKYVIRKGMTGAYGKLYNRLDGQIIIQWMREHKEQRMDAAILNSEKKRIEYLNNEKKPIAPEVAQKLKQSLSSMINFDTPVKEPVDMGNFKSRHENAMAEFNELPPAEQTKDARQDILKKWGVI